MEERRVGLIPIVQVRKLRLQERETVGLARRHPELCWRRRAPRLPTPGAPLGWVKGERTVDGRDTRGPVRMQFPFAAEMSSKGLRGSLPRKIKQPLPHEK